MQASFSQKKNPMISIAFFPRYFDSIHQSKEVEVHQKNHFPFLDFFPKKLHKISKSNAYYQNSITPLKNNVALSMRMLIIGFHAWDEINKPYFDVYDTNLASTKSRFLSPSSKKTLKNKNAKFDHLLSETNHNYAFTSSLHL